MWMTKLRVSAAVLIATAAVTGGVLPAQQAPAPQPESATKSKPGDSAALAQTEAKLARLRELIRPQRGEHVTNMARIAWERDRWVAAVKAGKEAKPVLVYAEGAAGIACGYG